MSKPQPQTHTLVRTNAQEGEKKRRGGEERRGEERREEERRKEEGRGEE